MMSDRSKIINLLNDYSDFIEFIDHDPVHDLTNILLTLKSTYANVDGNRIDYAAIQKDAYFDQPLVRSVLHALKSLKLKPLTSVQRTCLYINLYNLLTVHALCCHRPLPSTTSHMAYTHSYAYTVDGFKFTLNDLLHVMLRGNRPPPMSRQKPTTSDDPRLEFAVEQLDPRIHFAITNGAKDSPHFQVYTHHRLDLQLDFNTRLYLDLHLRAVLLRRQMLIPPLLHWYERDFGRNDLKAIEWSLKYLNKQKSSDLVSLINTMEHQGSVDFTFLEFDWSLNLSTARD